MKTLDRVMLEWLKGSGVNIQTTRFCNHMACQVWYLWIAVSPAEPFQDETERVKVLYNQFSPTAEGEKLFEGSQASAVCPDNSSS